MRAGPFVDAGLARLGSCRFETGLVWALKMGLNLVMGLTSWPKNG